MRHWRRNRTLTTQKTAAERQSLASTVDNIIGYSAEIGCETRTAGVGSCSMK